VTINKSGSLIGNDAAYPERKPTRPDGKRTACSRKCGKPLVWAAGCEYLSPSIRKRTKIEGQGRMWRP
jgi:hypothetical protein